MDSNCDTFTQARRLRIKERSKIYYELNKDKIKANSKAHYAKKKRKTESRPRSIKPSG